MSYKRTGAVRIVGVVAVLALAGGCAASGASTQVTMTASGPTAPWAREEPARASSLASQGYSRASNSGTGAGRVMAEFGLREDQAANDGVVVPASRGARVVAASGPEGATTEAPDRTADERALALLSVLDRASIEQSRLASARAQSEEVRWFAEAAVTRHTQAMERTDELARRLNLAPRMDPRSTQLAENAVLLQQELWGLRGRPFERAYVQAQVAQQERTLELIDRALLPTEVREPELRSVLVGEVRPMAETELAQARALQRELGARPGQ